MFWINRSLYTGPNSCNYINLKEFIIYNDIVNTFYIKLLQIIHRYLFNSYETIRAWNISILFASI